MAPKESWKSRATNCGRRATYYESVISVRRTPNILLDWRRPRPRFGRAFYHIQGARHSKDLGMKLVDYCTAAESLFLSSSGELMHQLSERISCFNEKPGVSRIETYRRFKRAYNFRSRVVHGAAIAAKDLTVLKELSSVCDDLLRRALRRLLDNKKLQQVFESGDDKFDDFFSIGNSWLRQ